MQRVADLDELPTRWTLYLCADGTSAVPAQGQMRPASALQTLRFGSARARRLDPDREVCEFYSISVDEFLTWERDTRSLRSRRSAHHALSNLSRHRQARPGRKRNGHVKPVVFARVTPILFWICRDEEEERWLVTVEDQVYGEYLNKKRRFSTP
jgi:hypothetical protein